MLALIEELGLRLDEGESEALGLRDELGEVDELGEILGLTEALGDMEGETLDEGDTDAEGEILGDSEEEGEVEEPPPTIGALPKRGLLNCKNDTGYLASPGEKAWGRNREV